MLLKKKKKGKYNRLWQHQHKQQQVEAFVEEEFQQREEEMALVECIQNAPTISLSSVVKTTHRSNIGATRIITMFIIDFLKGFDTIAQHTIIEKVLSHDLLNCMLLSYLQDIKRLKQNEQLLENVCSGLIGHVISQRTSKLALAKDIVCTFASFYSLVIGRETTKVLGVDKKNIKHNIEKQLFLESF